ncbi:hypothetical protein TWF225_010086 [Orbilia oligospora]|uniref:Uncharacterized protein n=1 Tax=Orbilia oligospora TaxID=2813651 RepID=A0A7C8TTW5_ORBOL|nr:hypothetical protein TWF751_001518 [Orbilia oligospora]KAF3193324.1 hypothetical protein TWF225_010086 [Orbilia oligospora]KAF3241307.1 hypothetical protein TWF128_011024 [Orbilia oligospora]KAF3249292.1 hypothetical protein TWF217_008891 [Orbilia oligospora]KAF3296367.1 hypothetical protein TWF132_010963 [Orbilia oligospora]
MTVAGVVDQIVDEFYPWAKPHGQNSWDKDQLGQPKPDDTLGQPKPDDSLGQPAPTGRPLGQGFQPTDELGQPLPSLDAPPAQEAPKSETTDPVKPKGSFTTFGMPVSNVRALPDDLDRISIVLDATVTPNNVEHYTAINFMTTLDPEAKYLETYIIHVRFENYDAPIHFTQKIQKRWTQNASVTNFTLKQASYDSSGTRKLRIVVNHVKEDDVDTYIFSFLSEDGQWLTHKFQPGYKIDHIYRYGSRTAGDCAVNNDLTVTPLPGLPQ